MYDARRKLTLVAALGAAFFSPGSRAEAPLSRDEQARRAASGTYREFVEFLALPNVEQSPEGWHLVIGAATDEERATYPKLASLTFGDVSLQSRAVRTDSDAPVDRWLRAALKRTFGTEPIRIRTMGGTVPTAALIAPLGAPFANLPLVNADNAQHAANENLRIRNYVDGTKTLVGVLTEPF